MGKMQETFDTVNTITKDICNDNPICKTEKDTDVQNRLWDSVGEGEGGMFCENSIETSILTRVKQITSRDWMHETSAQGWCTGKTQRDGEHM